MRKITCLAIGCIVLASCDSEQPIPVGRLPQLTASGPNNLNTVVRMVKEICVGNSGSTEAMGRALTATGWTWKQAQRADPTQPLSLDLWNGPFVTITRGELAGDTSICTIAVSGDAAPKAELLSPKLASLAGQGENGDSDWWWRSRKDTRSHMQLGTSAIDWKNGIAVIVENYRLPWWQTLIG